MFLTLNHQKLDLHNYSISLVIECYNITRLFPDNEKFGLISQIRRAATSVHLNLCEGAARYSIKERFRFFEISRSSLVELDAAFEIAYHLKYFELSKVDNLGQLLVKCFRIISVLIKQLSYQIHITGK